MRTTDLQTAVLIVGAGPVGLTLAAELTRFGVPVRIVDKAPHRSATSKALVLWSRSLELLARGGSAESFVAAGHKVTGSNIEAGGRRLAHIDLTTVDSPYPYALMLPQSDTERLLEAHLAALGITVERQTEVLAFSQSDESVAVTLARPDVGREEVGVAWLVGCDGAHSAVRHGLGMAFSGDTLPSQWILADVHLEGVTAPPSDLSVFWHASGVLALFPITPGRYRIIADVGYGAAASGPPPRPTLEEIQEVLDLRGPGGIRVSDAVWLSGFHINERKVADYRAGRVFLAGDAAHVHSPAGGQGMNTGMQDAVNLAWKLALVHHGVAQVEPLLSSYSVERSAVGDQVLANAGRLTAVAVLRNPLLQGLRNHMAGLLFGLSAVQRKMADTLSEVSIGYGPGPLVVKSERFGHGGPPADGPHAGERAPLQAGDTPVGAGDRPRFVLFAAPDAEARRFCAAWPGLIEPTARPPFVAGGCWLVRPDGYVAAASATGHMAPLDTMMASLAGTARAGERPIND